MCFQCTAVNTNEKTRGVTMKKHATIFLAFIILIISTVSSNSLAEENVSRGGAVTGQLSDVQYSSDGGSEVIIIKAKGFKDYHVTELTDPQRIVIDLTNAVAPGKQQVVKAEGKRVNRIRYAQFDSGTARVVLDMKGKADYEVEKTDTGLAVYIGGKKPNTFEVTFASDQNSETVAFIVKDYSKYTVKRLTDPERLIVYIPNAQYAGTNKQIEFGGKQVQSILCGDFDTKGTKVTIHLNTQSQYTVTEEAGKLLLTVKKPEFRNIEYHNNGDRVYFILNNAILTKGDEFLEKLYTGTYDESGNNYTITFETGSADLGDGVLSINDPYLKSFEVMNDREKNTTRLIFNGTGKNTYLAFTRNGSGITAITIMKPAADKEKLVVIDAGHGGKATGAIYKELTEKELNLDIALRLNKLLKEKGVKTYMLRTDDTDIANYERAYIANHLNASLYLSVHNNAMDNKNYSGTMTLYCPSDINTGFTGKTFANIIQPLMVKALKTVDRDVRPRPDLIVLKATNMPAALSEVAYMTNSTDRSNLQKESFRQKAAQALCDSVVKALKQLK